MDYKFLHKVVDQIVRETEIDYGIGEIQFPFRPVTSSLLAFTIDPSPLFSSFFSFFFSSHCKNVYGLNEQEIEYVWNNYREIVKDKLKNNGL